jgi:gamma-glutamylputrescine oxidase
MLDQAALAAHIASDRYVGGYIDWRSAHVNPLALTRGLAQAAIKAGAQLCERSEVTSVDVNAGIARTRHGKVTAGQLILATNAATEMLVPDLGRYLLPATTFMVATEELGERMVSALLPTDLAVTDSAFVMDYFRRSSDHRLLFGGGVSYFAAEPLSTATMLKQRLIKVFPHLAEYEVNLAWSGKLDITMNRMLFVRRLGRQCWTAFGFSGHGLALSVGVGAMLGTLGRHGEGSIAALEAVRHRAFPGGRWLRAPATTIGVKALQAWDWLRR